MGNWSTSTPAGPDSLSNGDDIIREFKGAVQEALRGGDTEGVEAIFPGSAPTTDPVYRYRGLKDTTANRPAAGQYGLYFDTTRNVLQRDNGSSWDDVGTVIPSGTVMVFYQASAPVGWTAVAVNDKFLRVVTAGGTGGSTGGTVAASTSLAHTHTVASHTHTGPSHTHSVPNHQHNMDVGSEVFDVGGGHSYVLNSGATNMATGTSGGGGNGFPLRGRTASDGATTTGSSGTGVTGGATPATDSQLGAFAYADVVIASKT